MPRTSQSSISHKIARQTAEKVGTASMTPDPPLSCCLAHFQMPPERCKEPFTLRAVYWGANSLCTSYFADFKQTCRAFLATSAIEPITGALGMTSAISRHTHIRREFLITGTSRKAAPSNTRLYCGEDDIKCLYRMFVTKA